MEFRGFFTSWATPRGLLAQCREAVRRLPSGFRYARRDSTSCSVTSVPMCMPRSRMICALTPHVVRTFVAVEDHFSFFDRSDFVVPDAPPMRRALWSGCSGGKISLARRRRADPPERPPRYLSTAGLTRTARPSELKSKRPSARPVIIWSTFSRREPKISRTSRSCLPRPVIFVAHRAKFVRVLHRGLLIEFTGGDAVQLFGNAAEEEPARRGLQRMLEAWTKERSRAPSTLPRSGLAKVLHGSTRKTGRSEYRRTALNRD